MSISISAPVNVYSHSTLVSVDHALILLVVLTLTFTSISVARCSKSDLE